MLTNVIKISIMIKKLLELYEDLMNMLTWYWMMLWKLKLIQMVARERYVELFVVLMQVLYFRFYGYV